MKAKNKTQRTRTETKPYVVGQRYSKEEVRAKGNPFDVPMDVMLRAMKQERGASCTARGCTANYMTTAARVDVTKADSWDNLRIVCKNHNEE